VRAFIKEKGLFIPIQWRVTAGGLMWNYNLLPMQTRNTETRASQTRPRKRSRYLVVHHQEAGLFDSMTGATLWALKNLNDWDWQVEPVAGAIMI
jgi:hypothetical protein